MGLSETYLCFQGCDEVDELQARVSKLHSLQTCRRSDESRSNTLQGQWIADRNVEASRWDGPIVGLDSFG